MSVVCFCLGCAFFSHATQWLGKHEEKDCGIVIRAAKPEGIYRGGGGPGQCGEWEIGYHNGRYRSAAGPAYRATEHLVPRINRGFQESAAERDIVGVVGEYDP